MALDAREEHGAGRGAAHGDDRHHRSFPLSGVTIPKPISFSDSPEYSQSYRKVRFSLEMTLLPTIVWSSPVTSERRFIVSISIFSMVKHCAIEDPRCSLTIFMRSALIRQIGRASCRERVCQYV